MYSKIKENEFFPCDLLILDISNGNKAYIETKNLDGETNKKIKMVSKKLYEK